MSSILVGTMPYPTLMLSAEIFSHPEAASMSMAFAVSLGEMHNIYQVCHLSCNPRSCERCSSCQVHTLWRPRCHLLGGITSKAGNIWLAEKVQYRAFSGIACRFFKNGCGVNNERIAGIGRCPNAFGLGWAVLLCFIGSCHYENDVVFVLQLIQHRGFWRDCVFGGFQT